MTVDTTRSALVSLRGNFHEGNYGDDALLVASAALLADCVQNLYVGERVAYRDERLAKLGAFEVTDALPDLIVYGGGTQFFSFGTPETKVTRTSRVLSLARKLFSPSAYAASFRARMSAERRRYIPKIAIGIGVGPFSDSISAETTAAVLRNMELVWVRDALSEDFCRSHGITNLITSADLCFTDAFAQVTAPVLSLARPEEQPRRLAIILRDWEFLDIGFFQRQLEVARRLRASGHEVRFFCMSPHDEVYLGEMAAAGEEVLVWDAKKSSLKDFWNALAQQDLIITSRFHGAIFALLSVTPFVAIEIEPKLRNLRDMVPELSSYAVDHTTGAEAVSASVESALAQRDQLLPALAQALAVQRNRARRGEDALKSFLESRMNR